MRDEVLTVICTETGRSLDEVEHATTLEDLDVDSIDLLDLVFAIEKRFSIVIGNEELSQIRTIDDLVSVIQRHVSADRSPGNPG